MRMSGSTVGFKLFLLTSTVIAVPLAAQAQQAQTAPVELEQIVVEGATDGQKKGQTKQDPARTVPLRQIPQTVSVVTRQRIEDQNFTQLEDAARRTPGLHVLRNDPGRSSIFSRGFEFDNASVDGLPAPMSSILGTQPDLAIFDRVEILRGPFGMFNGTGEPGGTLNLARKRATFDPQFKGSVSAGSFENYRAEIDAGGAVNESGTVRSRFVAAFQDRESFVDVNENQVWLGYGTMEFDLSENTTLSIAAWHQERESVPFNGLPATSTGQLFDLPRDTFIGADWNTFENATTDIVAELEHRFDSGGYFKASTRYSDRDIDYFYAGGSGPNPANGAGNIALGLTAAEVEEDALSADAHVNLPFELLGLEQNVILGMDYRQYNQENQALTGGGLGFQNVYNPNPGAVPQPTPVLGNKTTTDPEQFGLYGQLRAKPIEPLTLVLGGRVFWYEGSSTTTTPAASSTVEVDGQGVPYAGLILDITDEISAYVSYSEVYQPQLQRNTSGEIIDPRTGEQYEAGLKGSFFDGALNASMALFHISDVNRAIADPSLPTSNPNRFVPGEVEVKGFEAEIGGTVADGWEIYAGYAYQETEYVRAPVGVNGAFVTYWPEHTFSLWTKYSFQNPALEGWHIAGGAKLVSEFFMAGNLPAAFGGGPYRLEEDGYITVDAQIGYQINDNLSAALTATNIFDEKYYERVGGLSVFNLYGEPRAINLTVRATF
jgi:outer membrane receptor for ferric coprogen and ferric-rhodotorulic acid